MSAIEQLTFVGSEGIPNNRRLPVIVQHATAVAKAPEACEELFEINGWRGSWRDGIFPYHHFHSNAHEVLGIVAGTATVMLGGPDGEQIYVCAGDILVLPAGTGHKRQSSSSDLLVVGAYPAGQEDYDLRRGELEELEEASANVARVALPEMDPVLGQGGPVLSVWQATVSADEPLHSRAPHGGQPLTEKLDFGFTSRRRE